MKSFAYHRPSTAQEAARLAGAHLDGQFLAGGQSLLAAMKLRLAQPSDLIDLTRLDTLRGIRVDSQAVTIGALTTHAGVAASAELRRALPAIAELAEGIGDRQVRNRGTLGGSLANNDPAACYPAGVLGTGATIQTDRRVIAADDFFVSLYETKLEPGELITAVTFPFQQNAAYAKFRQPASHFAMAAVFVGRTEGGVRVAVTGAGPGVFRVAAMEQALARDFSPAALEGIAVDADGLNTDLHASAEYRAHLIGVLAKRAVAQALAR
jgi:carbon-monoxide dehydrogenase medium subunit